MNPRFLAFITALQLLSCVWLFCDPMVCSPPGSSVHGISQPRVLEWGAVCYSRGSSQPSLLHWQQILYHWATREVIGHYELENTSEVKWKSLSRVRLFPTLCDPMDYTAHGILQARILEWGAFPFSRGIFPTQGLNPGLPHCRWLLYQLSHKGSPRILEWVAYPFSSRSSQPRNQTRVSCIAGRFFTNSVVREAPENTRVNFKVQCFFCSEQAHTVQLLNPHALPALMCEHLSLLSRQNS